MPVVPMQAGDLATIVGPEQDDAMTIAVARKLVAVQTALDPKDEARRDAVAVRMVLTREVTARKVLPETWNDVAIMALRDADRKADRGHMVREDRWVVLRRIAALALADRHSQAEAHVECRVRTDHSLPIGVVREVPPGCTAVHTSGRDLVGLDSAGHSLADHGSADHGLGGQECEASVGVPPGDPCTAGLSDRGRSSDEEQSDQAIGAVFSTVVVENSTDRVCIMAGSGKVLRPAPGRISVGRRRGTEVRMAPKLSGEPVKAEAIVDMARDRKVVPVGPKVDLRMARHITVVPAKHEVIIVVRDPAMHIATPIVDRVAQMQTKLIKPTRQRGIAGPLPNRIAPRVRNRSRAAVSQRPLPALHQIRLPRRRHRLKLWT